MTIITRKRKDGSTAYQVKVRSPSGGWLPTETFNRKVDAQHYERKLGLEIERGTTIDNFAMRKLSFADYFADWQATRGGREVSAGWRGNQDQMARDHLLPVIGHLNLGSLSEWHVEQILQLAHDKGLSSGTKSLIFSLLHSILGRAVEAGILHRNPATRRLKPLVPRKERTFLKPVEAWKLLETCQSDFLGPAIWLATLAGLRCEAIQALRWGSVDLLHARLLIKEAYKRKEGRIGIPKGKDAEYVPLAKPLLEYLASLPGRKTPNDFVAPGKAGGMLDHHVFNDGVRRLCKAANVTRVTPHELRHSCSELYVNSGASIEDLRRLLQHKDSGTTERYVHRTPERLAKIAESMERPRPTLEPQVRPNLRILR